MCSPSGNFKLCTCDNDPVQLATAEFTWKLYRFPDKSRQPRMIMGKFVVPVDKLADHLDAGVIAMQMNVRNCFDFEYTPEEFDTLYINTQGNRNKFIRLRFNNGVWSKNHIPVFGDTELLKEGIVKEEK